MAMKFTRRTDLPRVDLNKLLYKAALFCINPNFRGDPEAVKAKRDAVCSQFFGQSYDQLTDDQVWTVIEELQEQSGYIQKEKPKLATKEMLSRLKFSAVYCALRYCPLNGMSYVIKETGEIIEGEAIRPFLKIDYSKKKALEKNVFYHLYNHWINNKCNQFLLEGEYKKFVRTPNNFYFHQLTVEECQYLIDRFREMHRNLENQEAADSSQHVPLVTTMN